MIATDHCLFLLILWYHVCQRLMQVMWQHTADSLKGRKALIGGHTFSVK